MAPGDAPPADDAGCNGAEIQVEVVRSVGPGRVARCRLSLPPGSRVQDALVRAQAQWAAAGEGAEPSAASQGAPPGPAPAPLPPVAEDAPALLALWGRRCTPERRLRTGDRVEWLRPLVVDPKESRRLRYRKTGGRQGGIERGLAARPKDGAGT